MTAALHVAAAVGAFYALVGAYIAYLAACKAVTRRLEARRLNHITKTKTSGGSR